VWQARLDEAKRIDSSGAAGRMAEALREKDRRGSEYRP
jgi:hypothetical protein